MTREGASSPKTAHEEEVGRPSASVRGGRHGARRRGGGGGGARFVIVASAAVGFVIGTVFPTVRMLSRARLELGKYLVSIEGLEEGAAGAGDGYDEPLFLAEVAVPAVRGKGDRDDETAGDGGGGGSGSNSASGRMRRRFYIYPTPTVTTDLVSTEEAIAEADAFYSGAVNENSGEIWLHRALEVHPDRTLDPLEADVFFVPAYLHLSWGLEVDEAGRGNATRARGRIDRFLHELHRTIVQTSRLFPRGDRKDGGGKGDGDGGGGGGSGTAKTGIGTVPHEDRPHFLLTPTVSGPVGQDVGLHRLVDLLRSEFGRNGVHAVAYETNSQWTGNVPTDNVLVAPYVVNSTVSREDLVRLHRDYEDEGEDEGDEDEDAPPPPPRRKKDTVFYYAASAPYGIEWAGCDRGAVRTLVGGPGMTVGLDVGVPPGEFQRLMTTNEYCLVMCGNTPTSRTLTEAVVFGCVPIIVGTRLWGGCDPPSCHGGWGWEAPGVGHTHLPLPDLMPWGDFPAVPDEGGFADAPMRALRTRVFDVVTGGEMAELRGAMRASHASWIYGWGSPVTSTEFGGAVPALWDAFVASTWRGRDGTNTTQQ